MAHKLDFQKGKAAFYSLNEKPWHGLGEVLTQQPESVDELLKVSGLDFNVFKLPNVHRIGDIETVSDNSFFSYRDDTNYVLGDKLGKQYTVLQNRDAFDVLEILIKSGRIVVETAGSIDDGRQTFITCRYKDPIVVGKNDEVNNYFCIFNSHDGSLALVTLFTPIRVVCNNTMQMALRDCHSKVSIKHTTFAVDRLKQATQILHAAEVNAEVFQVAATKMAQTRWNQSQFFDYVANVFCTPAEIKDMSIGKHPLEALSTRKTNIIKDVIEFAETGIGQQEAIPGTAWWAYNAVTGYFSNKSFNSADERIQSLFFGNANNIMTDALHKAVSPSKLQPVMALN